MAPLQCYLMRQVIMNLCCYNGWPDYSINQLPRLIIDKHSVCIIAQISYIYHNASIYIELFYKLQIIQAISIPIFRDSAHFKNKWWLLPPHTEHLKQIKHKIIHFLPNINSLWYNLTLLPINIAKNKYSLKAVLVS